MKQADSVPPESDAPTMELVAYTVSGQPLTLQPCGQHRKWMDLTSERYANRCLPLLMANQMGWAVLCPVEFMAIWNGENDQASIQFQFNGEASSYVSSHFGHGILTFSLGYLFRTPRGHNLWCKGPANDPKDGIAPLEGLIETDWAPYTFTMNWKFTRKAHAVWFREGEPICSLIPYPRAYISEFNPVIRPCSSDPTLQSDYEIWNKSRSGFLNDLKVPDSDARKEKWQRAYMVGADVQERQFDEHETRIHVRPFKKL